MAHYVSPFDIWQVPQYLRPGIQPGQWVYAGDPANTGMFLGASASTTVVAWRRNIHRRDRTGYIRALRNYGKSLNR